MTTYIFLVWVLVGTSPTPAALVFQSDTLAACEAKFDAQLKGQPALVSIGKCHTETAWLHVAERPEMPDPPEPPPTPRLPRGKRQQRQP